MKHLKPHEVANQFFQALMHNQCHVCWNTFTKHSQDVFLQWTVNDIYQRHPQAAQVSKIGIAEVKLLFENNDASLMKTFWKKFFFESRAEELFRFAYYNTQSQQGNQAKVQALMRYPDGRSATIEWTMINERGGWKFAYVESGLKFSQPGRPS